MFDLRKEVPNLELCKKLRELGYPQNGGGWYWVLYDAGRWNIEFYGTDFSTFPSYIIERIKAPTVVEIEEWLPSTLTLKEGDVFLSIDRPEEKLWILSYRLRDSFICPVVKVGRTVTDAFAKLLIYLVENGYVNFDKNKERCII